MADQKSSQSDHGAAPTGDGTTAVQATGTADATDPRPAEQPSLLKLLVEAGPLAVFFVANSFSKELFGVEGTDKIFWATGAFMIATAISLVVSQSYLGRVPILPLISSVFVFFFGGLT
ncbi:MAG: septation protein IspZ, partial [Pseudomonadota bacterium]